MVLRILIFVNLFGFVNLVPPPIIATQICA